MSKHKQHGGSKSKGRADARRSSSPGDRGRNPRRPADEDALSRMLTDYKAKEEEQAKGGLVRDVVDELQRKWIIPSTDSRSHARSRDDDSSDGSGADPSRDKSNRKRKLRAN